MLDRLTKNEIDSALDELIRDFGVKEEIPFQDLLTLLQEKDIEGCVREIAMRFGLPVRIILSYVPTDFRAGKTNRFRSSSLVRTDWTGRGVEGIAAQVSIPQQLPMLGTSSLQGFPIGVRVSENCHAQPETFVSIMAHELSHVFLASLRSPDKDSELHTDLVPLIFGFHEVVRRGRKTIKSTISGNTTTTQTSTFGYLTDSQFEEAYNRVTRLVQGHSEDRKRLLAVVEQVQRKLTHATLRLGTFREYFAYLDIHAPARMRKEHAERLVQLHGQDDSLAWHTHITEAKNFMVNAEAFARSLNHYRDVTIEQLKTHKSKVDLASKDLDDVTEKICRDERILRKYVGIMFRLKRTLRRRF